MIRIEVKGLQEVIKDMERIRSDQLPFATSKALNDTAKLVRERTVATMRTVFDRPTPFTLNAFQIHPATKSNLTAKVEFKHERLGYMRTQVEGGTRTLKRSESALKQRGIMRGGQYWVPGKGARLNQYGNISGGQIVQLLSVLQAGEMSSGYSANMTAKSAKTNRKPRDYFAVTKKRGGLLPGIYERQQTGAGFGAKTKKSLPFGTYQKGRTKGKISSVVRARGAKPILIFVDKAGYQKRLPFYDLSQKVVDQNFRSIFQAAAAYAMKTAR
jgi:hypothetical protein